MFIYDAALKTPYRILGINLPKDSLLHLSNLGLAAGEMIEVVTKTKNSAIIIVKGSRLAFDAWIKLIWLLQRRTRKKSLFLNYQSDILP